MKPVYNNSVTIIFLISILAILLVATTNVRAQLLKDTFDDANWKSRWEIHDDGNEGGPSQWFIGPEGGIPDGAFGTPTNILRYGNRRYRK